jgi:hypothetical protein
MVCSSMVRPVALYAKGYWFESGQANKFFDDLAQLVKSSTLIRYRLIVRVCQSSRIVRLNSMEENYRYRVGAVGSCFIPRGFAVCSRNENGS